MGVLACSRYGCDKIMCELHSVHHGYICQECYDELETTRPLSASDINDFMYTLKRDKSAYYHEDISREVMSTFTREDEYV